MDTKKYLVDNNNIVESTDIIEHGYYKLFFII